jgi:hypothetical protein
MRSHFLRKSQWTNKPGEAGRLAPGQMRRGFARLTREGSARLSVGPGPPRKLRRSFREEARCQYR